MTSVTGTSRGSRLAWLAEPRQLRSRWLHVLSQALDGYLRSPVFLVCMRYGLGATTRARALSARGLAPRRFRHRARPPTPTR